MVPVFERVFKQIQLIDIMFSSETTMQHIINNVDKNSSYIVIINLHIPLYVHVYMSSYKSIFKLQKASNNKPLRASQPQKGMYTSR